MPQFPSEYSSLPWWADPAKESVTDPLWSTMIKKAVHLTGLDDPNTAVFGMANPLATVVGNGKLEPFIVNMYKQRLRSDPSLAYHPGLQQVPEFQAAFRELFPNKEIVAPGQAVKESTYSIMKKTPAPPTGGTLAEALDAAPSAARQKPPRKATYADMKAAEGQPASFQGNRSRTKYDANQIAKDMEGWSGTPAEYARAKGIPDPTLRDILTRIALAKERQGGQ